MVSRELCGCEKTTESRITSRTTNKNGDVIRETITDVPITKLSYHLTYRCPKCGHVWTGWDFETENGWNDHETHETEILQRRTAAEALNSITPVSRATQKLEALSCWSSQNDVNEAFEEPLKLLMPSINGDSSTPGLSMAECTLLMKELTGAATNIGSSALEAIEAGKGGETLAASLIACSKHFRAGASAVIAHMKNNPVCQSDPEFMQRLQDTSTHMDDYLNSIEHMGESLLS